MKMVVAQDICLGEPRLRIFADADEAVDFADLYGMAVIDAEALAAEIVAAERWLERAKGEAQQAHSRLAWLERAHTRLHGVL